MSTANLLKTKLFWNILPIISIVVINEILFTYAYMKSVRIEEIPFGLTDKDRSRAAAKVHKKSKDSSSGGIIALRKFEEQRGFFHLFQVPCECVQI